MAISMPKECPYCHTKTLKELGSGTEKIEEEINKLFNLKVVRMDLDTTTRKGSHEKIINDFRNHKYDILLGTQMISKGLDFPNVTLVGVINADTSLFIPSYKSPERTFQLLSQVSGRSGRGDIPGKVILQTYNADHYAIKLSSKNDYLGFYNEEMRIRLSNKYPPYYYLSYLIIKSKDYEYLSNEVNRICNLLKSKLPNFDILGPTVCTPFKINNVCRFGILIKYKKEDNLLTVLRDLIDHYKSNSKIRIEVDFNPNNI
jgi:primosomal protein N' (replication factor Y)